VIGGCSFEARNQCCFYIDFTRLHLSFQLCVASANLSANPPCVIMLYWCVDLEIEALNKNIEIRVWSGVLIGVLFTDRKIRR